MAFDTSSVTTTLRRLAAIAAGVALVLHAHEGRAQRQPLQERLSAATALTCSFTTIANADWKNGTASVSTAPVKLSFGFKNVNVDEGSADAEGAFGDSFIVVRQMGDYLHLVQSYRSGPLYTTTVFARESSNGRFMAVHTRHEFTDVALPGFTSRPEMYVGDCAVTP
jgi:hypothetical protein